jgi:hypothetical protein
MEEREERRRRRRERHERHKRERERGEREGHYRERGDNYEYDHEHRRQRKERNLDSESDRTPDDEEVSKSLPKSMDGRKPSQIAFDQLRQSFLKRQITRMPHNLYTIYSHATPLLALTLRT